MLPWRVFSSKVAPDFFFCFACLALEPGTDFFRQDSSMLPLANSHMLSRRDYKDQFSGQDKGNCLSLRPQQRTIGHGVFLTFALLSPCFFRFSSIQTTQPARRRREPGVTHASSILGENQGVGTSREETASGSPVDWLSHMKIDGFMGSPPTTSAARHSPIREPGFQYGYGGMQPHGVAATQQSFDPSAYYSPHVVDDDEVEIDDVVVGSAVSEVTV